MNKISVFSLLVCCLFMLSTLPATAEGLKLDYGAAIGEVIGDNVPNRENWVPTFRLHLGMDLAPMLYTEVSGRYASLNAGYNARGNRGYSTSRAIMDLRLVFSPLHQGLVEPYFAAGFGISKDVDKGENSFHPLIPVAAGLRMELVPRVMLDVSGTYDLFLSDEVDGIERRGKMNPITDGKHDAFYGWLIGLTIVPERPTSEDRQIVKMQQVEEATRKVALLADPDDDGIITTDELGAFTTDPMAADTDGDGLSDSSELQTYNSDPVDPDSDNDGLNDGQEVYTYFTLPTVSDTDGDGLNDGEEVNLYRTDPLKSDTDTGGMGDGDEVVKERDPLDPSDDEIVLDPGTSLVLKGVHFEISSAQLTEKSVSILEEAHEALLKFPDAEVLIVGHSDITGDVAFNLDLSRRRAASVKTWLVERGIDEDRLATDGKGIAEPIADNGTAEGRARNRRIEFIVK